MNTAPDVIAEPHVVARNMLVELPRTDGVDDPVLIPGNPVKLSKVAEGPETRVPWVGEHTAREGAAGHGADGGDGAVGLVDVYASVFVTDGFPFRQRRHLVDMRGGKRTLELSDELFGAFRRVQVLQLECHLGVKLYGPAVTHVSLGHD